MTEVDKLLGEILLQPVSLHLLSQYWNISIEEQAGAKLEQVHLQILIHFGFNLDCKHEINVLNK